MPATSNTVTFGFFTLDKRRRTLFAFDKPVELTPRGFDLLVYLVEHHAAPVSRDDIFQHIWKDLTVTDNNLPVQISHLRKALVKAGEPRSLILTLPGPRYHFVGEVQQPGTTPIDTPPPIAAPPGSPAVESVGPRRLPGRFWPALAATAAFAAGLLIWFALDALPPAPPRLSFAVMPFRTASADRSQDYLADAITDDLTAELAHIPTSTVIARQSAQAVRDHTPQRIGRELNIRYILDGTIVPEDGHFHVTAALLDAPTGRQLWTAQFDATLQGVAALREEVVRRIANPLHMALDRLESSRSTQARAVNPEALDMFFRARSRLDHDLSLPGYDAAQSLLEGAVGLQPDFTDAKAELAWVLLHKDANFEDPQSARDVATARSAISDALAQSGQNTRALAAQAWDYMHEDRCGEARPVADHVLALEPSNLDVRLVLAACATSDLQFEVAASQYRDILRLDPESPNVGARYVALGMIRLVQGGHLGEAIELLTRARGDDAVPQGALEWQEQARLALVAAYGLAGQPARAHAAYLAYAARYPERTVWRFRAYALPNWRAAGGFVDVLQSLHAAGMPEYADETQPGPPEPQCVPGDFSPTPRRLPGGTVITTSEMSRRLALVPGPLVVDVGFGAAHAADWAMYADNGKAESETEFALRIAHERMRSRTDLPVIVLGTGTTGCAPYQAARALVGAGYADVAYYRGGEEAWSRYLPARTITLTARAQPSH